jgi:rhodanese-related sulfurtransferase
MQLRLPPVVAARDLAEQMAATPVRLLDVRTPAEFETAHIRGAYNVPLDILNEHAREIRIVNEPVVLVCASGQRAKKAEAALVEAGMAQLHVLDGGMTAWTSAGLPIVRGRERMSLERQVRIVAGGLAAVGGALAIFVNPLFGVVPTVIGSGLVCAGVTNTCGMAMMLARLPYNRTQQCDVSAMVRALTTGQEVES